MMSSRSSHRSHDEERKDSAPLNDSRANANETHAAGAATLRRLSRAQADRTIRDLTPYEANLVYHLDTIRFATRTQLSRLQPGSGTQLARTRRLQRSLSSLVERRVIARIDRLIGGRSGGSQAPLYTLDIVGRRLVALDRDRRPRRPWLPSDRFVAHTLAVTEVYVRLAEAAHTREVEVIEFAAEPACWRPLTDRYGSRSTLKPDAFVRLGVGDYEHSVFIEVDLATESLPTVLAKASVYGSYYEQGSEQRAHDVFPRVLWLVPTERRRHALIDAFGRLPGEHRRLHDCAQVGDLVDALLRPPP